MRSLQTLKGEKKLKHGILIAIEGIDGAGKTTQAARLFDELKRKGYPVSLFHEPTASQWGQKIAELVRNGRRNTSPMMEFELFYNDRIEDVKTNIKPALKNKQIVIMDRYYFSNVAYQGANGLDPKFIENENERIAPRPELVVILDISPKIALSRIKNKRNSAPNHFERERYLGKVRQVFLDIFSKRSHVKIVDGDDTHSPEQILSGILEVVEPMLRKEEAK